MAAQLGRGRDVHVRLGQGMAGGTIARQEAACILVMTVSKRASRAKDASSGESSEASSEAYSEVSSVEGDSSSEGASSGAEDAGGDRRSIGESGDDSDGESGADSDAELSFQCFNMTDGDYHSIKAFLAGTFGGAVVAEKGGEVGRVDATALAHYVVDVIGEYVGTTAKDAEEDDPYSFVTMVPFDVRDFADVIKEDQRAVLGELIRLLRETARKSLTLAKGARLTAERILEAPESLALVLHERFMNLPTELVAPLYRQLLDDLPMAIEESASFAPQHVVLIAPVFRELASMLDGQSQGGPAKRARSERAEEGSEEEEDAAEETAGGQEEAVEPDSTNSSVYEYYYGENELLVDLSLASWDFKIKTSHEGTDSRRAFGDRGVDPGRRVHLLTRENFALFVDRCSSLLSASS